MAEPRVGILIGSESDLETMERCREQLAELGIAAELRVLSAHRTPDAVREYARTAEKRGIRVLVAGAGMAAHLAGALASESMLPVVGVPLDAGPLHGIDALLSTVQMPRGLPVACMAIGKAGAVNAAVFAAQILALDDAAVREKLEKLRAGWKK
jgi:phosphoribosylaminoimidazole carboxylase PurE protein